MIRKCATAALPLAAAVVFGFCSAYPSFAQSAPLSSPMAPAGTQQFHPHPIMDINDPVNKLHLTKDQQDKINTITSKFYDGMNALQTNGKMTQVDKKKQAEALIAGLKNSIDGVLTPDQRTMRDQHNADKIKYLAARDQAEKKAQADNKLIHDSMTPAQNKKIAGLQQTYGAQLKALDTSTTMPQASKMAKAKQIISGFQAQLAKVLTPKQTAIFADFKRYVDETNSLNRLAQDSSL